MACSPGQAAMWPRVAMGSIPCWKGREGGGCTLPFTHGVGTVHEATQRGSLSRVVQTCLAPLLTHAEALPVSALRWNHFRKADSYPPRVLVPACCAMFVAVLVTLVLYATPASSAAPHIIYILTDDLGSNYPGCT